jgi:cellulose synthase/poly-beta-1,6-N-acetylglucosamine synthase-like glycosyltransferase
VKWLVGFCQIFRRAAVENLLYDEMAVAEDRDFSLEVGRRWRLVICGDLRLAHYRDTESRSAYPTQAKRAAFALGRSFAKRRVSPRDWPFIIWTFVGEMIIDLLAIARRPSLDNCRTLMWRATGFVRGFVSVRPQSV